MTTANTAPAKQDQLDTVALVDWFHSLRNRICNAFEAIERDCQHPQIDANPGTFTRTSWDRPGGGGGEMGLMRGRVFEKVGVNISVVHGTLSPQFRKKLPHTDNTDTFWAAGVSLVAHMWSPHVPAIHMNTRAICTGKHWFGGGIDMTPTFPDHAQTQDFHTHLKATCDAFDPTYYPRFKEWCDEYFFLKHRDEARGIGGIFYDYINTGDLNSDVEFTKAVGEAFVNYYPSLVRGCVSKTWTEAERDALRVKRGRYAEYNLLYDRGTRFGLETNGNIEAILMSLPPDVRW